MPQENLHHPQRGDIEALDHLPSHLLYHLPLALDGLCIQAQSHQSRQGQGQGPTDQRRETRQQREYEQHHHVKKAERLLLLQNTSPADNVLYPKHHHLPLLLCDSPAGAPGIHPLRQDRHLHVPGLAVRRGAHDHRLRRQALLHLEGLPQRQPAEGIVQGHRHVLHLGRPGPDLRTVGHD